MADDDLSLTISADASSAVSGVDQTNQLLSQLDAEIEKLVSAFASYSAASDKAEQSTKNLGGSARETKQHLQDMNGPLGALGGFAEDVAEHFRSVSAAAGELGLKTGESAAKIDALLNLFRGFGEATPIIAGVAGGALALFAAFEIGKDAVEAVVDFFRDAVSEAANMQAQMATLSVALKNQGGDWQHLAEQVKAFAELQAKTTPFGADEAISGIQRLVTAGMSGENAMKAYRIAEDAAAGSGKSLGEVLSALIAAGEGNSRALLQLGLATRQQVHDGMDLSVVYELMEERYGGLATAAGQTLPGALNALSASWKQLLDDVGTPFLGMLTNIIGAVTNFVQFMDNEWTSAVAAVQYWAKEHQTAVQAVEILLLALEDTARIVFDAIVGIVEVGWEGIAAIFDTFVDLLTLNWHQWLADMSNIFADTWRDADTVFGTFWDNMVTIAKRGAQDVGAAIKGVATAIYDMASGNYGGAVAALSSMGSTVTAPLKLAPGGAFGNDAWNQMFGAQQHPPNPAPLPDVHGQVGGPIGGGKKAEPYDAGPDEAVPNVDDQIDDYKVLIGALDDLPKSIQGYEDAITALSLALGQAHQQQDAASSALENAKNGAQAATDDYNTYKDSLDGVVNMTDAEKQHLKDLDDQRKAANTTLDQASAAYKKITGDVDGLTAAQVKEQTALEAAQSAIPDFMAKLNAGLNEDLATFKMTNAEKVAYYQQVVDSLNALDANYTQEYEQAEQKLTQAYEADVKERYAAEQQFTKQAGEDMANFVDAIVIDHKSLADELKSIYDEILKSFISMVTQMIVESKLFQSIAGWLFGFGGGTASVGVGALGQASSAPAAASSATSAAVSGASSYGILGAILGSQGAQSVIASIGTGSSAGESHASRDSDSAMASLTSSLGSGGGSSRALASAFTGGSTGSGGASGSAALYGGGSSSVGGGGGAVFTGGSASPSYGSSSSPSGGGASFGGGGFGGGGGAGASSLFSALFGGGGSGGGSGSGGGAGGINPGGSLFSSGLGGAAGGTIAGLGGIALGGSLFGQLAMGGKGFSDLGGALGGVAAAGSLMAALGTSLPALLAGGPLGWGIIAGGIILGSLLGSLFGDHFSQADEPDIYNQNAWGQENADMQGSTQARPMTANGKQFVMDSQTAQATNNLGWNIMMENFVQMFRKDPTQLSPDLQGAFPEIESLWGGAQNQADFNNNGKNGNLQLGSGEMASYTKFWAYIQNYGAEISALMSNYTASDVYQAGLNGQVTSIGSYTPGGSPGILHDFNDSGSGSGGGPVNVNTGQPTGSGFVTPNSQPFMPGQGLRAGARSTQITINVPVGGSLIAQNNLIEYIRSAVGGLPAFSNADMQTAF